MIDIKTLYSKYEIDDLDNIPKEFIEKQLMHSFVDFIIDKNNKVPFEITQKLKRDDWRNILEFIAHINIISDEDVRKIRRMESILRDYRFMDEDGEIKNLID